MDMHNLAESQKACVIKTLWSEKCAKSDPVNEPGTFSEMIAFTGLTQFCIRYTKTCQGNYPPIFFSFFAFFLPKMT